MAYIRDPEGIIVALTELDDLRMTPTRQKSF
jgi:hypothetical protein